MQATTDTIVAIATPPGRGGIGVIRLSGPASLGIAGKLVNGKPLTARYAHFSAFYSSSNENIEPLDHGLILYFPAPNSFTGEDVIELHGHGGPVVLDSIIQETLRLGARLARPGEFSERAFLNDKIDLAQAEAIADLIDSASTEAARGALRSLEGEFSRRINSLVEATIELRMYVEAAIDFPDEEIDFLSDSHVSGSLNELLNQLQSVLDAARQGALLREGMTVVIAGKPNAGKSSLLNALAGRESAIVTDIAGTTRDLLRENILIDGMPLHIIDTAGLRDSDDVVEQEGIKRAWQEIESADRILLLSDISSDTEREDQRLLDQFSALAGKLTLIHNKCDLLKQPPGIKEGELPVITLSAKQQLGVDILRQHLKHCMGLADSGGSQFAARSRHLEALRRGREHLLQGQLQLQQHLAGELLAEELRLCQQALGEITGSFTSDDLLGRIFSSFCVGK